MKVGDGNAALSQEEIKTSAVDASERFVDERSVAELFGVSTGYLANLRCRGGGPRYFNLGKPGRGRCIRYRISDVIAWAESRAAASTSECHGQAVDETRS
jgi:predicted DNA-binding transcriptional regulator AlpA